MDCFSDDFLAAYLERTVSLGELESAEAHLDVCGDCRAHVAAFARLAARDPEATRRDPVTELAGAAPGWERTTVTIGQLVAGRYLIESRLGGGGMGVVYRAHDQLMDRRVAIKLIAPRFSHDMQAEPRFLRECRLAARFSHLNAVMVLDHGRLEDGHLYLVMELLIGRTLHEHLRAGPLPEPRALHIGSQICDALDAAHRLRIVHRDLKPANIVILDDPPGRDFVKVLDFGIARSLVSDDGDLTRTHVVIGTPEFTAPEVLADRRTAVDERADLYSLGVVLSWMLAGRPALADTGHPRAPHAWPPLDQVRFELRQLVEQLVEVDPHRRPTSAAEVRARLAEMQAAPTPAPISFAAPAPTAPRPAIRHRRVLALTLSSAVLVAVSVAVWAAARPSEEPAQPEVTAAPRRPVAEASATDAAPPAREPVDAAPTPAPASVEPDAGAAIPPDAAPPDRARKKRRGRRPPAPDSDRPAKSPGGRPEYFRP